MGDIVWQLIFLSIRENFFDIYYFLHKLILHIVKNILWKYILCIFNIDCVRPC